MVRDTDEGRIAGKRAGRMQTLRLAPTFSGGSSGGIVGVVRMGRYYAVVFIADSAHTASKQRVVKTVTCVTVREEGRVLLLLCSYYAVRAPTGVYDGGRYVPS